MVHTCDGCDYAARSQLQRDVVDVFVDPWQSDPCASGGKGIQDMIEVGMCETS